MQTTATGWGEIPIEIRCIILSFLTPREIGLTASLVSKAFNQAASHDEVWRLLCLKHFPHYDNDLSSSEVSVAAATLPGTRVQCYSKEVKDEEYPSWQERYRVYSHRLFVMHHKYNDINERALADALLKWKQAGAVITDVRVSTDEFVEPRVNEWVADIRQVMRRHRVLYLFTDGGMRDGLRGPIGDALADFVEEGKAVIIGTFSNVARRERPGGRWENEEYNPLLSESQLNAHHDLGVVFLPEHPVMKGITKLNTLYKALGKAHPKAIPICAYDHPEQYLLVAEMPVNFSGKKGLVVSVNVYLPSSDSPLVGWKNEGGNQVVQLHANVLNYAIHYVINNND